MTWSLRALWHSPTFTTWGSLLVRLASVVALLPVVLVRFTPAEVAVWQLLSALFLLGLMLDYGLAPTFVRLLSYARAGMAPEAMGRIAGNRDTTATSATRSPEQALAALRRVIGSMHWLYPRLAWVVTGLLLGLGSWALLRPVSQVPQPLHAWLAWAVVMLSFQVALWGGLFGAALQGMNRIAELRRWEIAFGLLQVLTSVVALAFGAGILELLAVYQLWTVLGIWRNARLLARLHPDIASAPTLPDPAVLAAARSPAWRSVVGVLCSTGVIQLSGVYYSQILPAAQVASWLLALRLAMVVSQFSQAPLYTKLPWMAEQHAAGRRDDVLAAASRGMRLSHIVFVMGALAAAIAAPPLLAWVDSQTAFVSGPVFAVLALAFFAERLGAMHIQLYSLTNHVVWHIANGITGAIVIGLTLVLGPELGLMAFPLAMLAGYAGFYVPYAMHRSRRAFSLPLLTFERRASLLPALALGVGMAISLAWTGGR
ncbi:MAG: lipopolysaccharide biosynthesis protein [Rubrivivax sp.]|nr:hypothetical protein [Rubrivivax sp.]